MRVIAGVAKGRPLKGPKGVGTRPTSDKVKGAIFSMLESLLVSRRVRETLPTATAGEADVDGGVWSGLQVLDLYAGTGALGIEALSRGASRTHFVDASAVCQRLIKDNLDLTGLAGRAHVYAMTAKQALDRLPSVEREADYHVVLVDAPYGDPGLPAVLEGLARSGLLASGALVVVEHSRRTPVADSYDGLRLVKRRRHGDTEVSIYESSALEGT